MNVETGPDNIEQLPDFSLKVKDEGIIVNETEEAVHIPEEKPKEPETIVDDEQHSYHTDSDDTDY
jgi:hypothetical protein